jgi:hypothetical protein
MNKFMATLFINYAEYLIATINVVNKHLNYNKKKKYKLQIHTETMFVCQIT